MILARSTWTLDQRAAMTLHERSRFLLDPIQEGMRNTFLAKTSVYLPGSGCTARFRPGTDPSKVFLPGVQVQKDVG